MLQAVDAEFVIWRDTTSNVHLPWDEMQKLLISVTVQSYMSVFLAEKSKKNAFVIA
jgi:hypothetical protein